MYSIGEIISTYRKKKGLLQQDLADELANEGITISYKAISNWERNLAEPSVTIFYKVCRILGITNMYEAYFGVNPADPFSSLTFNRSSHIEFLLCFKTHTSQLSITESTTTINHI